VGLVHIMVVWRIGCSGDILSASNQT